MTSKILNHASGGRTTNRSDSYHQSYRDVLREGSQWIAKVVCGPDRWLLGPFCSEVEADRAGFSWMRAHLVRREDQRPTYVPNATDFDVATIALDLSETSKSTGEERLMAEVLLRAIEDLRSPFLRREAARWFLDRKPSLNPFAARNVFEHFGINHSAAIDSLDVLRVSAMPDEDIAIRRVVEAEARARRKERVA